ncbi:TIGR04063 family PEP-CTERM/XrtA system glycosyltransferase [Arhodomonas sp. SL1]|uniref:TIGR04063 family PEP-CTERM/XrtA system glycosyltransferase n=1 Tax=Arhodomonas sp. SL1 TaxID=3425691 RepID=UPI003F885392
MRILHVLDHSIPLHSGYAFRSRALIEGQQAMGWKTVHVTSPKQGGTTASMETVGGLTFHRTLAHGTVHGGVRAQWRVVRALAARLADVVIAERPDIIHAHSPALNGVAAWRVARRFRLPFVYEVRAFWEDAAVDHGTTKQGSVRYRLARNLETWVLRHADAVTCICDGLRADILDRGVPAERVTVIPNAVAPELFADVPRDPELVYRLGLEGCTVAGFIGSFYAYEGLDLAVDVVAELAARYPRLCLVLVGGGPQKEALQAQVERLGLGERVVMPGRVAHDEVARYYGLMDVMVYPRRAMRLTETVTPLKPLEAMAQGRLVLASDVGGHRELVRDGETGRLFPAGSAAALATALDELLADAAAWPGLRERGRAFARRERTWTASVARYREVYTQAGTVRAGVLTSHG